MMDLDHDKLNDWVSNKEWDSCWHHIYAYLQQLKDEAVNFQDQSSGSGIFSLSREQLITQAQAFAPIFLTFIHNDNVYLSDDNFKKLLKVRDPLHSLLHFAGYDNTDPELDIFLRERESLNAQAQKKLCLLISMTTRMNINALMHSISVNYRCYALIFNLIEHKHFHPACHDNKIRLLSFSPNIRKLEMSNDTFPTLMRAGFYLSYIDYEHKHTIKPYINANVRQFIYDNSSWARNRDPASRPEPGVMTQQRERPRLVILGELYRSGTTMYTSWRRRLLTLQEHFEIYLIGIDSDATTDKKTQAEFENVYLASPANFDEVFRYINDLQPDMTFMPSLGLTIYSLVYANIRLAPLQIYGLGMPATAMSDYMDFVVCPEYMYTPEAFPKEKCIDDCSAPLNEPGDKLKNVKLAKPADTDKKSTVNVVIPTAYTKLTSSFIKTLRTIRERADFDIHFTFLTNSKNLMYAYAKEVIETEFPNAKFYGTQNYKAYFDCIKQGDIALNPYPFGQDNMMIDICLAGKPSVNLLGTEPHSRTSLSSLRLLGLDHLFTVETEEDYINLFFDLARQIMDGKREFFDPQEIYDILYNKATETRPTLGDLLYWTYRNAERLYNAEESIVHMDEDWRDYQTSDSDNEPAAQS